MDKYSWFQSITWIRMWVLLLNFTYGWALLYIFCLLYSSQVSQMHMMYMNRLGAFKSLTTYSRTTEKQSNTRNFCVSSLKVSLDESSPSMDGCFYEPQSRLMCSMWYQTKCFATNTQLVVVFLGKNCLKA